MYSYNAYIVSVLSFKYIQTDIANICEGFYKPPWVLVLLKIEQACDINRLKDKRLILVQDSMVQFMVF